MLDQETFRNSLIEDTPLNTQSLESEISSRQLDIRHLQQQVNQIEVEIDRAMKSNISHGNLLQHQRNLLDSLHLKIDYYNLLLHRKKRFETKSKEKIEMVCGLLKPMEAYLNAEEFWLDFEDKCVAQKCKFLEARLVFANVLQEHARGAEFVRVYKLSDPACIFTSLKEIKSKFKQEFVTANETSFNLTRLKRMAMQPGESIQDFVERFLKAMRMVGIRSYSEKQSTEPIKTIFIHSLTQELVDFIGAVDDYKTIYDMFVKLQQYPNTVCISPTHECLSCNLLVYKYCNACVTSELLYLPYYCIRHGKNATHDTAQCENVKALQTIRSVSKVNDIDQHADEAVAIIESDDLDVHFEKTENQSEKLQLSDRLSEIAPKSQESDMKEIRIGYLKVVDEPVIKTEKVPERIDDCRNILELASNSGKSDHSRHELGNDRSRSQSNSDQTHHEVEGNSDQTRIESNETNRKDNVQRKRKRREEFFCREHGTNYTHDTKHCRDNRKNEAQYYCEKHGNNHTHNTVHCKVLLRTGLYCDHHGYTSHSTLDCNYLNSRNRQ